MKLLMMLLLSMSSLSALDAPRQAALDEIVSGLERAREALMQSSEARNDPALAAQMKGNFDRMIAEYRADVEAGRRTPGSQVDKDLRSRERSLQSARDKGKDKVAADIERTIRYVKWLIADPTVPDMPAKAVIY